jgi:hypothetical protein
MWKPNSFCRRRVVRSRGKFRFVIIWAVAIVLLGAGTAGALADTGTHCVVRLVPIAISDDGVIEAQPVDEGCYASLGAALEAGTGGEFTASVPTDPSAISQDLLDASLVGASDVLLGTEYDGTSFAGASKSYFASSGCANTTWQVANVGSTWNDQFESGKGFGTCDHNRKFEHENFGGSVVLCTPNCGTYGSLRNEVTSLRWAD